MSGATLSAASWIAVAAPLLAQSAAHMVLGSVTALHTNESRICGAPRGHHPPDCLVWLPGVRWGMCNGSRDDDHARGRRPLRAKHTSPSRSSMSLNLCVNCASLSAAALSVAKAPICGRAVQPGVGAAYANSVESTKRATVRVSRLHMCRFAAASHRLGDACHMSHVRHDAT